MKIGIMSMHRIVNYGSYLQSYALRKVIESFDNEVVFVDYHINPPIIINGGKKDGHKISFLKRVKLKLFREKFKRVYWRMNNINSEYSYNSNVDCLIIGSDEVFNCFQSSDEVGYSMELFGKDSNTKKLATYAASFGNTTLEKIYYYNKAEEISNYLDKFDHISVRDYNSYFIVSSLLNKQPVINIDPVLLYDFYSDNKFMFNRIEKKPYILVYAYTNRMRGSEMSSIRDFAKKNNLKIITIGGEQSYGRFKPVSPFEIMAYFKYASLVITDTFHGTIFSIINKAKFYTLIRKSSDYSYGNSEKLEFLLSHFELNDRSISSCDGLEKNINVEIDYIRVFKILADDRKKSYDYLKSILKKDSQ